MSVHVAPDRVMSGPDAPDFVVPGRPVPRRRMKGVRKVASEVGIEAGAEIGVRLILGAIGRILGVA